MVSRLALAFALTLPISASGTAQTSNQNAQPERSQKDSQAATLLNFLLKATGWTKQVGAHSIVVSGQITRHFPDGPISTPFTIKMRGDSQYEYSEEGNRFVTNGPAGASVSRDGRVLRLPPHVALSSRGFILPMFSIIPDWESPDVDAALVGESSVDGDAVVGVELVRRYPKEDRLARSRKSTASVVLWISKARNILVRADYPVVSLDNYDATSSETLLFSDYRLEQGMLVPFHEELRMGDKLIKTLQFSSVDLSTNLAESDFRVPASQAGGAR